MIHTLTPDRWTKVAQRTGDAAFIWWRWEPQFNEHALRDAHDRDEIIMMRDGDTLVARVAGPHWRRLQARMRQGRA